MLKTIFTSVLLLLLLVGCQDNSVNPVIESDFSYLFNPNNFWEYTLSYPNTDGPEYNMIIKPLAYTTTDGTRLYHYWQRTSDLFTDTLFVSVYNDTIEVRMPVPRNANSLVAKLVYPIQVGNVWSSGVLNDFTNVKDIRDIDLPAGMFSKTFYIVRTWNSLNDYGLYLMNYAQGVGIVFLQRNETGLSFVHEEWKLKNYKIQ